MDWRDLPVVRDFGDLDLAEIDTWPRSPKVALALVIYGALICAGKAWWLDARTQTLEEARREHNQLCRKIEDAQRKLGAAHAAQVAAQAFGTDAVALPAAIPAVSASAAASTPALAPDAPMLRRLQLIERFGLRMLAWRAMDEPAARGKADGAMSLRVGGSFDGLRTFMRALAEDEGDDEIAQWKLDGTAAALTLDLTMRRASAPAAGTQGRKSAAAHAASDSARKAEAR